MTVSFVRRISEYCPPATLTVSDDKTRLSAVCIFLNGAFTDPEFASFPAVDTCKVVEMIGPVVVKFRDAEN